MLWRTLWCYVILVDVFGVLFHVMAYVLILWRNEILFDVMAYLFYGVRFDVMAFYLT